MNEPAASIFETARLSFRCLTRADVDALARLYSDPEIRKYFPDKTLNFAQTSRELDWFIDVHYAEFGFGLWATIHKQTGKFIGRCGLIPWQLEGKQEVEVAYLLDKAYWGQGLATEAASAIQAYAFEVLKLPRLISLIDPAHQASIRVAQKTGMTLEQAVDGIDGDGIPTLIYSVQRNAG